MAKSKYAGTQTEKNLQEAFAGESQARNKYTYFASVAKKEGYEQMSALFLKTADNEKEHAKMWFKELAGIGDTKANLEATCAVSMFFNSARYLSSWCFSISPTALNLAASSGNPSSSAVLAKFSYISVHS